MVWRNLISSYWNGSAQTDAGIIQYHTLDDDEGWRIEFLKCLLVERDQGSLEDSDLEWLELLCTD